jgi:hypothetical protein
VILIEDNDDWVTVKNTSVTPTVTLHEGHSISSRELAYILKGLGYAVELTFDGEREEL